MADYQGVLADLRNRRTQIEREKTELDNAIASLERLARADVREVRVAVTAPQQNRPQYAFTQNAFSGLTMPQAVMMFLEITGQPQTARQIREGVIAGGARTSPNARGHIYNTLVRLRENGGPLVHLDDGRWAMRGWPAAKNAQNRLLPEEEE